MERLVLQGNKTTYSNMRLSGFPVLTQKVSTPLVYLTLRTLQRPSVNSWKLLNDNTEEPKLNAYSHMVRLFEIFR